MKRPAKTHDIKTDMEPFWVLWNGEKTFEFRRNDRDYQVGDTLILREYFPDTNTFSGRAVKARVTHLIAGPSGNIPEGYVCMSLFRDGTSVDGENFLIED